MNYQHHYHAGNSADVFKHVTLLALIQALQIKTTPICLIETHAGVAVYDLHARSAQATHEYQTGIARLWTTDPSTLPETLQRYLTIIKHYNPDQQLRYYPGSTVIASHLLRAHDRMHIIESENAPFATLKTFFNKNPQVHCHQQNGYQHVKGLIPPKERRGLVFLDPIFEQDEFLTLPDYLTQLVKRWPTGIYALWFPIKDRQRIDRFYHAIQKQTLPKVLVVEFCTLADNVNNRMNGSGMLVINAPFQCDAALHQNLLPLHAQLNLSSQGQYTTRWLL